MENTEWVYTCAPPCCSSPLCFSQTIHERYLNLWASDGSPYVHLGERFYEEMLQWWSLNYPAYPHNPLGDNAGQPYNVLGSPDPQGSTTPSGFDDAQVSIPLPVDFLHNPWTSEPSMVGVGVPLYLANPAKLQLFCVTWINKQQMIFTPSDTPTDKLTDKPTYAPNYTPTDTPSYTPNYIPTYPSNYLPNYTPIDILSYVPNYTLTDAPTDAPYPPNVGQESDGLPAIRFVNQTPQTLAHILHHRVDGLAFRSPNIGCQVVGHCIIIDFKVRVE
ncbi:hypothetical protein QBC43DRAFT_90202 [Cladorrhinum sp. PSN259]|nr:hypothetical protein QBC43DRAFT_90202 [Cladorrhinum sp. PSN259]